MQKVSNNFKYNQFPQRIFSKEPSSNTKKVNYSAINRDLSFKKFPLNNSNFGILLNSSISFTSLKQSEEFVLNRSKYPELASLSNEKYNKLLELMAQNKIGTIEAIEISELDDKNFEIAVSLIKQGNYAYDCIKYAKLEPEAKGKINYLVKRGLTLNQSMISIIYNPNLTEKIMFLLENGYQWNAGIYYFVKNSEEFEKAKNEILSDKNPTRDFLKSENYLEKIKQNSKGKYQDEIIAMFAPDTMPFKLKADLIASRLSEEDILTALQAFSKSTFKLAFDTPNQYLSGIDTKYTTKYEGKYPELDNKTKLKQQEKIKNFFSLNMGKILKALKYLDLDTVNQMMDKRTDIFSDELNKLDSLDNHHYQLLSDLIRCKTKDDKNLTAKEKIQLCNIIRSFQDCDLNTLPLELMAYNKIIDFKKAKSIIANEILKNAGFSDEEIKKYTGEELKFNQEFMYTILMNADCIDKKELKTLIDYFRHLTPREKKNAIESLENDDISIPEAKEIIRELYEHPEKYSDSEISAMIKNITKIQNENDDIYVVVRHAILEDFDEFISNPSNRYGETNLKTKEEFLKRNLDFAEWLNPSVEDTCVQVADKQYRISMWKRNPFEDLFVGNKTSCCTAIGTGSNDSATPAFLLNKSYNVVEMYDEKNNTTAMARIFMAEVDKKPSVIIDTIELNQNFNKHLKREEEQKIRDGFFEYINKIAKQTVKNNNYNIYYSMQFAKVPAKDLETTQKTLNFIGSISQNNIYLNCMGNWIDYRRIQEKQIDLYVVPKEN